MLSVTVIMFLMTKLVIAQLNGEFWWLNDKLAKYTAAAPPKFENLTEFDTDESAKIVFRDNNLFSRGDKVKDVYNMANKGKTINTNEKTEFNFQDKSEIIWPDDIKVQAVSNPINHNNAKAGHMHGDSQITQQIDEDIFEFKFPEDDNFIWKDTTQTNKFPLPLNEKNKNETVQNVVVLNDKVPFKVQEDVNLKPVSICTFLNKSDCNSRGGVIYLKYERVKTMISHKYRLICCILPISRDDESKIHFFDIPNKLKRQKRYTQDEKKALAQRKFLLMHKFSQEASKTKTESPPPIKSTHKIVTADEDYVDPYANIKSFKFKNSFSHKADSHYTDTKQDYYADDYVQDYVDELPKPGLGGLYSDHADKPNWSFVNKDPVNTGSLYGGIVNSEEDDKPSFVYGVTIDPRIENRVTKIKPVILGRPANLKTQTSQSSEELTYNTESQTINYQSHPDFQVLQGFKLLNLVENKSRIYKNIKKTTTTESVIGSDSKESVLIGADFEGDYEDLFDTNLQVYRDCGKILKEPTRYSERDQKLGDAEKSSHPWLALVVLTRNQQTVLCYATLVHTRAAVTTADCIHGRSCPGEVTLIAGAWDLNDESHERWQKRMASASLHSDYRPGELENNLAILYWKRPLRLSANVQPACLTDPHVGDECMFVGWGGYDQAIRPRSRWQRATILTPRACNERLSANKLETLPNDAFCANVPTRGTVTGIGGPLICAIGGRHAVAGVAIWRDNVVLLAPAHEWTKQTLAELRLQ